VFSGADVSMQAKCGGQERIIRAQILDKDMFDPSPGTPKNTSWTMQLLSRMDHALGSSVMDRPVFSSTTGGQTSSGSSQMLRDLGLGKYDALFQGSPHKPSQLYRMAQEMPHTPDVEVQISPTVRPEVLTLPAYPPIARTARVEGTVIAKFTVIEDGSTSALIFKNGHPILRAAVERAASAWKFPKDAVGQELQATVVFKMNCSAETE
jgi:TonB family protein